ncbi:hypothetical protein H7F51_10410 [Novosphingobium flavum]|uniref:Uncharacterized protein n=1 Tax=Novosphingobium flavum TaxID=1778672 RepID=A0A7X1KM24_9SPHN|nr:hypothetical protein [Novosphingobium flavum]MBC2665938.1 hypothetical protein [Novosphingobium flavum]
MPNDEMSLWRYRAGELALACGGSFAADEVERLRELLHLLRRAPLGLDPGLCLPDAARVEPLLAAGGAIAVALSLFDGSEAGYILSRGGAGQHIASVFLPGAGEETNAGGESASLAMLGALCLALAELTAGVPISPDLRAPDGARLN